MIQSFSGTHKKKIAWPLFVVFYLQTIIGPLYIYGHSGASGYPVSYSTSSGQGQKKDAPSGTAITLAEQIIDNVPSKKRWVNTETATVEELPIISKRIDPAPGTHTIKYTSPVDDIEIIHTAHNRTGFAGGAVLAAEFIKDKKGIFAMRDVLRF